MKFRRFWFNEGHANRGSIAPKIFPVKGCGVATRPGQWSTRRKEKTRPDTWECLFQVCRAGWSRDTACGTLELLSNRRKGSLLSRSPSAAKSRAELHSREPERSRLSDRHEDRVKRASLLHRGADRVSVCVAGKSMVIGKQSGRD